MTSKIASGDTSPPASEIPLEQLVAEVYDSAEPILRDSMVAQLVGKVYQTAPTDERFYLIRQLMQPLGILSLLAIANGVFAKIRLQGGLANMQSRLDDLQGVQVSDVVALANYVQQVSLHALDGLTQMLAGSPALAGSAAAALLAKLLMERASHRRETDRLAE